MRYNFLLKPAGTKQKHIKQKQKTAHTRTVVKWCQEGKLFTRCLQMLALGAESCGDQTNNRKQRKRNKLTPRFPWHVVARLSSTDDIGHMRSGCLAGHVCPPPPNVFWIPGWTTYIGVISMLFHQSTLMLQGLAGHTIFLRFPSTMQIYSSGNASPWEELTT